MVVDGLEVGHGGVDDGFEDAEAPPGTGVDVVDVGTLGLEPDGAPVVAVGVGADENGEFPGRDELEAVVRRREQVHRG